MIWLKHSCTKCFTLNGTFDSVTKDEGFSVQMRQTALGYGKTLASCLMTGGIRKEDGAWPSGG
jgi:hypothetical protein